MDAHPSPDADAPVEPTETLLVTVPAFGSEGCDVPAVGPYVGASLLTSRPGRHFLTGGLKPPGHLTGTVLPKAIAQALGQAFID